MTSASSLSSNVCYRHPDRQSYILCQRCGRTVCTQCQTQAAVGVQCPDCIKEGRANTPRTKPAFVTALRSGSAPVVTYSLMVLCVIVWLLQIIPGSTLTTSLVFYGPLTVPEPWRLLTAAFAHSTNSPIHLGFNMFSLFIFGPILEQGVGRVRFLALYLVSAFGGSVAVLLLAPTTPVLGASGAIFGLMGAVFIIMRHLGSNTTYLLVLIGINLVIGFLPGSNVSWEAHLGGLIAGAAVAFIFTRTRHSSQRGLQIVLVGVVVVALIALTLVGVALL